MTSNISLLKSFVDGQGAGAGTYVSYPADLDANFTALESAFNSLNTEFKAFGGANSALIYDLTRTATITNGFIGAQSFTTSFISANTVLRVTGGEAMTGQGRIAATSSTNDLTGSGSSGTRYAALTATGAMTLETSASQQALDLYSVNWNGTSFDTNTLTRLPGTGANNIIVDADDFQAARIQENINQGTAAVLGAFTYDTIAARIHDIVRVLAGKTTSSQSGQATLKPIAINGTVSLPALILTDGASTFDTTTGLYRVGANSLGISVQGVQAVRFEGGSSEPQALLRAGTALGTPPLTYSGDGNTGFGWVSADRHRAIAGGLSAMEWSATGGVADVAFPGTVSGLGGNRWGNTPESLKTGNYTIVAADRGAAITANSASALTFSLTAAATLGAGFTVHVRNINTGVLTVDPSGAELINGLSTLTLAAGHSAALICTGTEWRTLLPDRFSALPEVIKTGTYTVVGTDLGSVLVANSASALAFNLTAVATIGAGFACWVKNIGAGTLTVDPSGAELVNGVATLTVRQGEGLLLWSTGSEWRALQMRDAYREVLTAARGYFVRSDGSDSNEGRANTAGGAFLTLQKAIDVVAGLDLATFAVTITIGTAGSYAGFNASAEWVGGPGSSVSIVGDAANAGNFVITSSALVQNGCILRISGVDFTPSSGDGLVVASGARVTIFGACNFGAASGARQILIVSGGSVTAAAALTMDGSAANWILATDGGSSFSSNTITHVFSGTPTYTTTVVVQSNAGVSIVNATPSGAANGTRYSVTLNGVLFTNGGGATFIPGSVGGSTATGGQYA